MTKRQIAGLGYRMPIEIKCSCGRTLRAPETAAGKRGRCPACGSQFSVPTAPPPPEPEAIELGEDDECGEIPLAPVAAPAAVARPVRPPAMIPPHAAAPSARVIPKKVLPLDQGNTGRGYLYFLLLLTLIPLAWSTARKDVAEITLKERVHDTIVAHPEIRDKLETLPEDATVEQLFEVFPNHKLQGAWLPKDTWLHWGLAAFSGMGFLVAVMLLFPAGYAKPHSLAAIALFTGTAGILMLLAFQWIAFHMPLFHGGRLAILLDLIWLIGRSYAMALGDHGFLVSFLGFTAGVGLCEEICKAIPLAWKARKTGFSSWRSAMLWGLLSGVGFGVSEGITYSSNYYNGISGPGIYAVRFISCVGLHAIWAAAVGITIFRRQDFIRDADNAVEWIFRMAAIVVVPMVLHGAYDTLLKQHYETWALVVAIVSFGWLAFQIETAKKQFDESGASLQTA